MVMSSEVLKNRPNCINNINININIYNINNIKERWRQNSALYHSCFHLSTFRFLLPIVNFGSSVLHIAVEPETDCCRYVGVV